MGPQGSGKGTQAALLRDSQHFFYIASGDIARHMANEKSGLGDDARKLLNEGKLFPDEIMNHGIEQLVSQNSTSPLLFDGYPRTLIQAEYLIPLLEKYRYYTVALELFLDDSESIKRILMRKICSECKSIIFPKPGMEQNTCLKCGGKLIQRSDDTVQNAKQRLTYYHQETEPVINYFNHHKMLFKVDAKPSILKVSESVNKILDNIKHGSAN